MKVQCWVILFCFFKLGSVNAEQYSLGVVPQFEVRKLYTIWNPILQVLEDKTGYSFKLLGAESIPEFENALAEGLYDFAYMNPWHAQQALEQHSYQPLVKDGVTKLQGILVVKKNSQTKQLSQLEGQSIAFPSPNAFGASLLIRSDLTERYGIKFNPVYVGTHSSVYLNVLLNTAQAGGGVLSTLTKQKKNVQDSLQIIYKTQMMSPHPFCVHSRVSSEVAEKVKQAFFEMRKDVVHRQLLAQIPMANPNAATIEEYRSLKNTE